MFNHKKEESSDVTELVKPAKRLFLARKRDISDLETLVARIKELKNCIDDCYSAILSYSDYIEGLNEGSFRIERNSSCCKFFYYYEKDAEGNTDPELNEVIRAGLLKFWTSKIEEKKELIHTCEDELDWITVKIQGLNQQLSNGSFNFDPEKDHA